MNAVWLVVCFCGCLDLIGIASKQTIVAIFSITAPALDLSYIAVIIAHRIYEKRVQFIEGPYTLGRWSKPVNAIAVIWVLFISVVLFFPPERPITAENMNYAIAVAILIALFSVSYWFLGARRYINVTLLVLKQFLDSFIACDILRVVIFLPESSCWLLSSSIYYQKNGKKVC